MFTGIVEEVGVVGDARREGGGVVLQISAPRIAVRLNVGGSVAINGVCLTAVHRNDASFSVQAVEETLRKTALGELEAGAHVNIECALRFNEPLGGHFVLGHVDTVGVVQKIEQLPSSWMFSITFPVDYLKYVIPVGSIAVDGVSMTVASIDESGVRISVIPHTWENTVFKFRRTGDLVNLEFDVLGKYVERLFETRGASGERDFLSEKHLRELGL